VGDTSTGPGKVVVNRSMSLDGFIAGPGDAMDWIFDFMAPDAAWLTEIAAATGAMLVGRRTDEVGDRMDANMEQGAASSDEGYPFSGPMFVLTHNRSGPAGPDRLFWPLRGFRCRENDPGCDHSMSTDQLGFS
jgi:dihydrofolate reductase